MYYNLEKPCRVCARWRVETTPNKCQRSSPASRLSAVWTCRTRLLCHHAAVHNTRPCPIRCRAPLMVSNTQTCFYYLQTCHLYIFSIIFTVGVAVERRRAVVKHTYLENVLVPNFVIEFFRRPEGSILNNPEGALLIAGPDVPAHINILISGKYSKYSVWAST